MLLNEEEHDYYRDESSEWEGSELINFEKFRRLRVSDNNSTFEIDPSFVTLRKSCIAI